ncbi:5-oxoprolinase/urea amidolyase family protein (plasmid) [Shinella sp. PSBB067]|uniref:5-oxoprolinase subunit B/C family protein n=1 Tax=Shinella sp. PSBB067 TaxID=2715959 RepID=UPI00193C2AEB|nr:5-oxoprolinase/urea amidolyase family protein [Shinella sp. PSBB067]QRI61696.1 5-oxoprolinase/urea amidolyase family protein [Shinella sp. PSBB067]
MRFLPVSLTTILVELADLDETLALFASLQADPVGGIEEMVPAARTLMIRFRPEKVTSAELAARIATRDLSAKIAPSEHLVEIPVRYDGEDLADVAELTGLTVEEVVRRHTESEFTVAFCGFAPGFGYLVGGDPALHVPRRKSPRTRIPAGSVALAGAFSGVYPQASPGGWQIIGTTPVRMWDIDRDPGALFQPGYRVRFFDMEQPGRTVSIPQATPRKERDVAPQAPQFKVLAAPMPAVFQDLGRFGQTGQGVSASGALDRAAFNAANRIVGNPANTPVLELTLGGFSLACNARAVIGLAGAASAVTVRDAVGRSRDLATYEPVSLEPGDVVTIGQPKKGMRAYLAVRGGFDVAPVLGSAATDTLAVVGPEPVTAGTVLALRGGEGLASVSLDEAPAFDLPSVGDVVTLDVVLGPRTDWFTEKGIETLTSQHWQVTPQSSRVGIRLAGEVPLERRDSAELPSEGTVTGAIQVPHSGQPVFFLADHPLTGGYPVIGAVAEYHLDLAGQIPINAKIRFRPIGPFAEIAATR